MRDKIHIYISLIAALVMTIVCILQDIPIAESASRLVLTIVIFYVIGLIAEDYIKNKIFPETIAPPPTNIEEPEEDDTDTTDTEYGDTGVDDYNYTDETIQEGDYYKG